MMSLGVYRPRKPSSSTFVPQSATSVKRSSSVPINLGEDAKEFMRLVVEEATTSIPEDRALSPLRLADSVRAEEEDYFLPMDEEEEEDHSVACTEVRTRPRVSKVVEQQLHRQVALTKLEEFFMGESCSAAKTSPVSVLETPEAIASSCTLRGGAKPEPKRNMFGQIIQDGVSIKQAQRNCVQHQRTQSVDYCFLLEDAVHEDVHSIITHETNAESLSSAIGKFNKHVGMTMKLNASDRSHSLPTLQYMTCSSSNDSNTSLVHSHALPTKKPSLKMTSSFGQGLSKKDTSDGGLMRTVSFSSLSIREYPPAISDNPSCSFGPPVQLDWDFEAEATHPIDHYEKFRQPRRRSHDLLLSYYDRRFLLIKQAGYSRREVKEAMKEAERVKRERMVTDLFLPAQALDETMETVVETVKRFFTKPSPPS